MIKAFGRLRSARRVDEDKKSNARKSSLPPIPGSSMQEKWGNAISTVIKANSFKKKDRGKDPFLDKFTVTGRAFESTEEEDFYCSSLCTKKFWAELVFDPADSSYYFWSMISGMAIMYNLIFIILRMTFYENTEYAEAMVIWYVLDYLSDALYMVDMFVKSRLGFLESGLLVKDVGRLRGVYLESWMFKADIISIIPLDLFYFLIRNSAFRLNRVVKIWRMLEFFRLAETHTNFPNLFGVARLILYIIIIIHWNACFYFAISRHIGFGTGNWTYPDPRQQDFGSFPRQYLTCFYWSCLTLTTIGDTPQPESVLSYFFCIMDSLLGVLIFATIFGNVGALINEMDAARTEYQSKVDAVKRYMELRGVISELQVRVIKWFDYTWNNKQSYNDDKVLTYLPEKLRAEISIHVHLATLRRVDIFKDCEPGLLVELVLKLHLQVFSPGDYICRKGDIGKDMYIVKHGRLEVVSEDGKNIFVTLTDGSVFGEISVLNIPGSQSGNRRTASVRSVGYSDLFCLSKKDLWDALKEYPEAKEILVQRSQQLLRKDNLLDEGADRRETMRLQDVDEKIELISDAIYDLKREVKRLAIKIDNCNQNSSQTAKVGKAEVSLKSSSIMDGKKKNKEADTPDVTTSKESTDK